MKIIKQTYQINSSIDKVWEALVNPKIVNAWGGGPAKMDAKVGSKFSLWGGDIHGKNIEVVKNKKLVQDWYGGEWDEPSKLIFNLTAQDGKTQLELVQENVPDKEYQDISDGWQDYYIGPMKAYLEKR